MIVPFLAVIVLMGVYPKPFLDRIDPSVKALITHVETKTGEREPAPAKNRGAITAASAEGEGHSDGESEAHSDEPTTEEEGQRS